MRAGQEPTRRRRRRRRAEFQRDSLEQTLEHLALGHDFEGLWRELEATNIMADQARHLGGFDQSARDIERFALPAAIETQDWPRFLRHALVALHLRRVAEGLSDQVILRALVRAGQAEWARDAAARLGDALERIAARAAVAAELDPAHGQRSHELHALRDDIVAALPSVEGDPARAAAVADTLASALRALPLDLGPLLPAWRGKFDPSQAARLSAAYVAGCVTHGAIHDESFWVALGEAARAGLLSDLPEHLGTIRSGDNPEALARRLRDAVGGVAGHLAAARWLDALVEHAAEDAVQAWDRIVAATPADAPLHVLAASGRIFAAWDTARRDAWCAALPDPLARATLHVAALEAAAQPSSEAATAAWSVLRELPDGPARLNLVLRLLTAAAPDDADEWRRRIAVVGGYLDALAYAVDSADLARYLDLVGRHRPADLESEVAHVAWTPGMTGGCVLGLIEGARVPAVPAQFVRRAESYAAAVAPTEGEGFRLRARMLAACMRRLCLLTGDLSHLVHAAERLLPEEEDALRFDLAALLARGEAGVPPRPEVAADAARGIRDGRLRLRALLPLLPPDALRARLAPRALYADLADSRPVADELRALTALLRRPSDPPEALERPLGALRDEALRVRAHLRLARHRLAWEQQAHGHMADLEAPLERLRPALGIESEEALARLVPEIAEIGALARPRAARVELEEAARTLAELKDVPWSVRRAGLERLLGRIGSVLGVPPVLPGVTRASRARRSLLGLLRARGGESEARRGRRRAAAVLRLVLRLRFPARDVLPMVTAAAERLGLRDERFEAAFDAALRDARGLAGESHEDLETVAEVCRRHRAREALRMSPALAVAEARRGAARGEAPEATTLERIPAAERDALIERVIVDGWLRPEAGRALTAHVTSPVVRQRVELALAAALPEGPARTEGMLTALAALVATTDFDPADPGCDDALARMAEIHPGRRRKVLALAVVEALQHGGRRRGERALRVWLQAHLGPQPGFYHPGAPRLVRAARAQIRLAARLPRRPQGEAA